MHFSDKRFIIYTSNTCGEIQIYNVKGEKVYSEKRFFNNGKNEININCSDWEVGVYVLKIVEKNTEYTVKLIKQ